MDLKTSLQKLEQLRDAFDGFRKDGELGATAELYGEVEDLVQRLDGIQNIRLLGPGRALNTYATYIEAALYSGMRSHDAQAVAQIRKLIGKVRALLDHPEVSILPSSIGQLSRTLQRFRECCQFLERAPKNERDVQDIVWIMLRAQFDRVEREETLPRFGQKNYRPDFGVPELGALVEVKFIGSATDPKDIQDELLADSIGYLAATEKYSGVFFLTYDAAHKLRDPAPFISALKQADGVLDAFVVPGIG